MAAILKLRTAAFKQELRKSTANGLLRAGTFYHAKCKEVVSVPNTGEQVKTQDGGSVTIYPSPSAPGEAPRLRTGFGQRNIVIEFNRDELYVRVGVNVNALYMFWLELGTRHIARRPWLVQTLNDYLETIGRLAASGK